MAPSGHGGGLTQLSLHLLAEGSTVYPQNCDIWPLFCADDIYENHRKGIAISKEVESALQMVSSVSTLFKYQTFLSGVATVAGHTARACTSTSAAAPIKSNLAGPFRHPINSRGKYAEETCLSASWKRRDQSHFTAELFSLSSNPFLDPGMACLCQIRASSDRSCSLTVEIQDLSPPHTFQRRHQQFSIGPLRAIRICESRTFSPSLSV